MDNNFQARPMAPSDNQQSIIGMLWKLLTGNGQTNPGESPGAIQPTPMPTPNATPGISPTPMPTPMNGPSPTPTLTEEQKLMTMGHPAMKLQLARNGMPQSPNPEDEINPRKPMLRRG